MQQKVPLTLQQNLVGLTSPVWWLGQGFMSKVAWGKLFLRFSSLQCESATGTKDKSQQLGSAGPPPELGHKERLDWFCAQGASLEQLATLVHRWKGTKSLPTPLV